MLQLCYTERYNEGTEYRQVRDEVGGGTDTRLCHASDARWRGFGWYYIIKHRE
jgi:hypothetical protein